jgi:hypothetical protein
VAKGLAGSDAVRGDLSSLQTQLNALIEKTNATAQTIYGPIAADWGKLQRFQAFANRTGAWAALPLWVCGSSRLGTSCGRRS